MENNRVVIDTNVLISAIIGKYNYPYKIFDEFILTGDFIICLSQELLNEYEAVTRRNKFHKIPGFSERAAKLIQQILKLAVFVEPKEIITIIPDEPDNRVLELAVAAKARAIVTGNIKHFNFTEFRGIKIQTPKEFYEEFSINLL